jgi:predicted Zn-dependent protease
MVAPPASAQRVGRATPAELRAIGERVVQRQIAIYGRVDNSLWNRDVGMLLNELTTAAGVPRSAVQFVIVNDSDFNATALPGGFLIVNAGLLRVNSQLAALQFATDSARRQRYLAFTAAVLGHELAHQTLGHTAQIETMLPTRAQSPEDESLEARLERAMADPALLRRQAKSRTQEQAADRTGALYMLRAGFEIQAAMDLFRVLDSLESSAVESGMADSRRVTIVDSVKALSWLSDHPRASQREAALETFRGTLKLDQGRFDDALLLVRTNLQLDTAVTLLDSVLAHFPELREAQHLRAAALHRLYLRHLPPERQIVRSAVPTYTARFISRIRGDNGLDRAREAYRELLQREPVPYALSNLAVLDAYAGDRQSALARADSAVALDSSSAEVRLNQGAVLFLSGKTHEALAAFRVAARLAPVDMPALTFDVGRTLLALGDSARGRELLARYGASDAESEWGKLALHLAGRSRASGAQPAGAERFMISASVALGERASDVRSALGAPDRIDSSEGRLVWRYDSRGVRVAFDGKMSVIIVVLTRPEAGSVDGLRVGDAFARIGQVWGVPDEEENGVRFYERRNMILAVEEMEGRIATLTVGVLR